MVGSLNFRVMEVSMSRRSTVVEVEISSSCRVPALAAHECKHLLGRFRGDTHGSTDGYLKNLFIA